MAAYQRSVYSPTCLFPKRKQPQARKAQHEKARDEKAAADKAAADKATAERLEAEQQRKAELELARPDADKLMTFLQSVKELAAPALQSDMALTILEEFDEGLEELIEEAKAKAARMIA